jgi:hypothetical protein
MWAAFSVDIPGRRQGVVATLLLFDGFDSSSLRASAGVCQPSVSRRSVEPGGYLIQVGLLCRDSTVPLGKYWRSSPLVFSLLPRCQGECGSQK